MLGVNHRSEAAVRGRLRLSVLTPTDSLTVLEKNITTISALCLSFHFLAEYPLTVFFPLAMRETTNNQNLFLSFFYDKNKQLNTK